MCVCMYSCTHTYTHTHYCSCPRLDGTAVRFIKAGNYFSKNIKAFYTVTLHIKHTSALTFEIFLFAGAAVADPVSVLGSGIVAGL